MRRSDCPRGSVRVAKPRRSCRASTAIGGELVDVRLVGAHGVRPSARCAFGLGALAFGLGALRHLLVGDEWLPVGADDPQVVRSLAWLEPDAEAWG